MDAQFWIIGQIMIDVIMVALLFWFARLQFRKQPPWQEFKAVIEKSESILSEMEQLGQALEKNLAEKKKLSRHILEQLDQGLTRAQRNYEQIQKVLLETTNPLSDRAVPAKDNERMVSSIKTLLAKGLARQEIAQHLGISVAEIELIIKLNRLS
jgi:hypothetical protein